ncbi:MAG: cell wall hydrolase [Puniceicoccaceae bacterium]|nr:MAG: cell wall hydrolase [Puniceicoccaceae bacterium]
MKSTRVFLLAASFALLGGFFSANEARAYTPDPWERQVVAATLILEASSDGEQGMRAVMAVIVNRANGNPRHIYREVRRPWQFSSLNTATTRHNPRGFADHVRRASRDRNWRLALAIVDDGYAGRLVDITGGATHFSLVSENTAWMRQMRQTTVIGSHKFFAAR